MEYISGSTIYAKLRELVPNLPHGITPEVLNNLCEDNSVQPFLKWFCENISCDNILSNESLQLKKHIQKNDTWLEGKDLDLALAEATRDCPELLKLIESDNWNGSQSFTNFNTEKELYNADFDDLETIENSIKELEECKKQMDNEIDKEIDSLKKEETDLKLIYDNCNFTLEDFDSCHRQLFKNVELLANTYIDAVQKKGEPCLWTQMPIELYIKQLENYSDYLTLYAKQQFPIPQKTEDEVITDHASILSDSNENDKLREIIICQKNLYASKMHEIISKVEEDASESLVNHAIKIYNNGNLKVPSTPILASAEIAQLTKSRIFLEESVNRLEEKQLVDTVQKFSKVKVFKVLEEEAKIKLLRRQNRLSKLERLCALAKEHGYAFSTLLCMLFELQSHRIYEIMEFVIDARHYLSIEYSLSPIRCDSMQKLQNEYASISTSFKNQNTFSRMFIEMAAFNSSDDLQSVVNYYNELQNDNSNKLKTLLDVNLTKLIESTRSLETEIMDLFNKEMISGSTLGFRAIPCCIQDEFDKTVKQIEKLEVDVESIRSKLKTIIKETSIPSIEREQLLLWQKFLICPETLKARCQELEALRDQAIS